MNYIKLMRPKHYLKNVFVFLPLFFSGYLFNINKTISVFLCFMAFNLMASTIYIINDIADCEKDKLHEIKKHRPIPSGKISPRNAKVFAIILFMISIFFSMLATNFKVTLSIVFLLAYFVINLAYSIKLKHIALIDVACIVAGFILRVIYGGSIINISVSSWLLLTVTALSFFLAFGKRKNEITKAGSKSRKVLENYSIEFLDRSMSMCLGLTITFYSLWCNSNGIKFVYSVPFMILLCMRYNMNISKDNYGDPTDILYSDKLLLSLIGIIIIVLTLVIYI